MLMEIRHIPPGTHFTYGGKVFMRVTDVTIPVALQDRNAVCVDNGHLWSFMEEEQVETVRVDIKTHQRIEEGFLNDEIQN